MDGGVAAISEQQLYVTTVILWISEVDNLLGMTIQSAENCGPSTGNNKHTFVL